MMALTFEPIARTTISSNVTDVTFTSITQAYTDLRLALFVGSQTNADNFGFHVNGDTTNSNYFYHTISNDPGSGSVGYKYQNRLITNPYTGKNDNFSYFELDFLRYSINTGRKNILFRASGTQTATNNGFVRIGGCYYDNDSPITSITIFASSGFFSINSQFTLYGITAA
jgi:hypothetical protein